MKIKNKISVIMGFFLILSSIVGTISVIFSDRLGKTFRETSSIINNLKETSTLDNLSLFIRYYDEVLTQSARNYAFTSETKWKDRYFQIAPLLDKKIEEAISLGSSSDKIIFKNIGDANLHLIKLEESAITLVDNNKNQEAISILNGEEYSKEKLIYQQGLESFALQKGKNYNETLTLSTNLLEKNSEYIGQGINNLKVGIIIGIVIFVIAGLVIYLSISRLIFKPLNKISLAVKEIFSGNLKHKIGSNSKDELGVLANSFDQMAENLASSTENIEAKIFERTQELEKLNKYMSGREIRMLELKKEIEQLKNESNKSLERI